MNLPPGQTSDDTLTVTAIQPPGRNLRQRHGSSPYSQRVASNILVPVLPNSIDNSVYSSDTNPSELAVPPALRLANPILPAQLKVVLNLVS
jgi:hypothetical protein